MLTFSGSVSELDLLTGHAVETGLARTSTLRLSPSFEIFASPKDLSFCGVTIEAVNKQQMAHDDINDIIPTCSGNADAEELGIGGGGGGSTIYMLQ